MTKEEKVYLAELKKILDEYNIIVDTNEPEEIQALIGNELRPHFKKLPAGDFLINNYVIERCTVPDFMGKLADGRIWEQAKKLNKARGLFFPLILIEGDPFKHLGGRFKGINPKRYASFVGAKNTLRLKFKIPVIETANMNHTIHWLQRLLAEPNRWFTQNNYEPTKLYKSRKKAGLELPELQKLLIKGLPGVGDKTVEKMLEQSSNPIGVFLRICHNSIVDGEMNEYDFFKGKKFYEARRILLELYKPSEDEK